MAIAPQQLGIGIRRLFTEPGVDPYESVEWERRDARIQNFKDGGDAFFQAGVEFPATWSLNATNIVAQKYFRGQLGRPERESSLREVIDRVVDTITDWGASDGYFIDRDETETFRAELKYLLVHQRAAFNSPVWFNIGVEGETRQASACFILSVDDTMNSILNWYREEGIIFKGGSGAGVNLSRIRSSVESVKGGGTASGPVSFMRGADASAGTIKSAGKTRRAAKMVILDVDHPDIEEFVWCKAREEHKARALRDAGFDMDLDGKDSHSLQYQNANNSVRVTDEFMQAVVDDADWPLHAVSTGDVIRTVKARDLMHQISEAAWQCADPGMQFDTTINRWHTAPNTARINASNPCCFVGETLVDTSAGTVRFDQLHNISESAEELPNARSLDLAAGRVVEEVISRVWVAGYTTRLVEVSTNRGLRLRCTPEHRFLTGSGEHVAAQNLVAGSVLRAIDEDGRVASDSVCSVVPITLIDPVAVYDLEVEGTHNFSVASEGSAVDHGVVVHNSEYMHIDNSACNLSSINLLKYLVDDDTFDVDAFRHSVEVMFTAQEILVGNADYPTEAIAENTRKFRQLGIGYANLGALLMAEGYPYDSEAGRAWAAAITALLTGHAYATSARIAAKMGPFAGFAENAEPMLNVLRMHRAEVAKIDEDLVPPDLLGAAQQAWDQAVEMGETHGVRNAQASVLAPTGCLVGGTLVPTERGVVRLGSLGNPAGEQWQQLGIDVQTDDGPRPAAQFYVNGVEPVVDVTTRRGYRIRGTVKHRVKVVDENGAWVWRRLADLREGDRVPLALDQLVGEPQEVVLPPLGDAYWTAEWDVRAPRAMTAELAELVGYFMGDGSLHARGIRLCVAAGDFDVAERLEQLGKDCFGLPAKMTAKVGYVEVRFDSVRLAQWWEGAGFAKHSPVDGHSGKGWEPHIPNAVLHANDRYVYGAFLRGLFEADGTVTSGIPHWATTSLAFSHDVQSLLLALGYPTTRKLDVTGWGRSTLAVLRLLNTSYHSRWLDDVGFIGDRKHSAVHRSEGRQTARQDHIPLTRELVDRLAPDNDRMRKVLLMEVARGRVSRRLATALWERVADPELGRLLSYFYDTISTAELGDEELTYDLSVPDNVTYVANGFVSHNTIGLMMDCDTTGIEPDLALTKAKKLVGGGTMYIVNQTVPRALRRLGYSDDQVDAIVNHIDEHKTIIGAPGFDPDHLPVFACSMGDNTIHYMGHVTMMSAVQPFISGAISKCVEGPTLVATAEGLVRIQSLHQGEAPGSFRDEVIEVASLDGTQKTDAFYYGGTRPVREVVLRAGHRIVATPNHRLLVAGPGGIDWVPLSDLSAGDYVAVQYGHDLWSPLPARITDFQPSKPYGSQKAVRIPAEMSDELAFLLGAYASEGHTTASNYTVTITSSVDAVLERVAAAWRYVFGVEPRLERRDDRCPQVMVSSKVIVELLAYLGCGSRASEKRIPDAVLRSPRSMVLAFLQGLALDAYTTVSTAPKWAICLDSPGMLDDLQAVLVNLNVVHGRVGKYNRQNGKTYDEVYATGEHAQRLVAMVPFLEPDKATRAAKLSELSIDDRHRTSDVVPGVTPRELYEMLPKGRSGSKGRGTGVASEFRFLCDRRTQHVTRRAVERVSAVHGVVLPEWLQMVLRDDLHFSPVESVSDAGMREVFDVSVPTTHAFVGNGIVNHNTVNLPEEATVEDVEELHLQAWKLGLKAVAIYRDRCKVGQPLSSQKEAVKADDIERIVERVVEKVIVQEPVRQKLPRTRRSKTFSFRVADCHGYATVGEYEDGRPGEIFLKVAKQGSTLAGVMDAFAISVSHGLQYGVPLEAFVEMFTNMRFEPAGMTDDPEIRFAASLVDYIFRRMAVEYMSYEKRADLGILTVGERTQPTLPGVEEEAMISTQSIDLPPYDRAPSAAPAPDPSRPPAPPARHPRERELVLCNVCGDIMQRAGSCYACPSCGSTSGCS